MGWPKDGVTREVWITTLAAFCRWLFMHAYMPMRDDIDLAAMAELFTNECEAEEAERERRLAKGRLG